MKTKFNLKILLLVAILLITMCLFSTNMVQATDVTAEETKTDTTTEQTTKVQPSEDTLKLIPDTMTVSIKEIEFQKLLAEDSELKTAIMKILTDNNVDMTNYQLYLEMDDEYFEEGITKKVDIHKLRVNFEGDNYFDKVITVKYSNTDKYNENDSTTINKIYNYEYWTSYSIEDYKNRPNIDTVYEEEIKNSVKTIDSSIQCIVQNRAGNGWGELGCSKYAKVYYFKNDVFYAGDVTTFHQVYEIVIPEEIRDTEDAYCNYVADYLKSKILTDEDTIKVSKKGSRYYVYEKDYGGNDLYIGFVDAHKKNTTYLCDGITTLVNDSLGLSAETIKKDNSVYAEMQNKLKEKGYTNILNAYELKLTSGKIGKDGLTLNFDLGTANNGKQAIVLHKKADGSYEEFIKTIENGRISITVTELSPFMVAVKDTGTTTTTTTRALDNEPKTGVADYTIFASVIALISLGGIVILKFKK